MRKEVNAKKESASPKKSAQKVSLKSKSKGTKFFTIINKKNLISCQ